MNIIIRTKLQPFLVKRHTENVHCETLKQFDTEEGNVARRINKSWVVSSALFYEKESFYADFESFRST